MTNAKPGAKASAPDTADCCGHKARREDKVDEALSESFPASDPPAFAAPQHRDGKQRCCCSDKTGA